VRLIALIFCILLLPISASHASVINIGDPVFGPNSLVLDTDTGLEWLQPKFTFGQSPAQVLANPKFASFQYGSLPEFGQLGTDFFSPDFFPSNPGFCGGGGCPVDPMKMTDFIDLLGGGPSPNLLSADLGPIIPNPTLDHALACITTLISSPFFPTPQAAVGVQCAENAQDRSFLVRPAVEPSSVCLLLAPALGLALWRSRRRDNIASSAQG